MRGGDGCAASSRQEKHIHGVLSWCIEGIDAMREKDRVKLMDQDVPRVTTAASAGGNHAEGIFAASDLLLSTGDASALNQLSTFAEAQAEAANAVPERTDGPLSERSLKNALMSGVFLLRFADPLEKAYRSQNHRRAITIFRFYGLIALVLFAGIGSVILQLMPPGSLPIWFKYNVLAFLVVAALWGLSWVRAMDRWFDYYATIGAGVSIVLSIFVNFTVGLGDATPLSYIGLAYILFFTYCFVGLRFPLALMAGWLGGVIGVVMTYAVGGSIPWHMFNGTFTAASVLGMCLAYGLDRQERINFLQSTLLRQTLQKTEQLSREDSLTGLSNRRYLNETLDDEWNRAMRYGMPIAIMLIDIDFFKRYNDKLGHLEGDKCLRQVADLIGGLAHRSGEIAARYGGEEFVLVFPNMELPVAEEHAERLMARLASLALPHPASEMRVITVSVGLAACIPTPDMTVDQMMRFADAALYRAKANGRNRCEVHRFAEAAIA